ncbi:hypothetical protein AB0L75_31500 [Streptomyces sp. NPDC052101]|uniref:hypothetical protein n=1 Tax=Streptomyces sp. NPDC052101 TaxID=3155763 RepID=UPI00343FFEE8
MTFPAALLGTAVRMLRTGAGRRALQLVLLVAGLFALGFLCGEQAHAAEATPVPAKVTSVPSGAIGRIATTSKAGERGVVPVREVGEPAGAPVRHVVSTVSTVTAAPTVPRSLEGTAAQVVDKPRTPVPSLPLPDFRQVQVPDLPVHPTPQPQSTAPAPPRHGGATAPGSAEQKQPYASAHAQAARTAVGAPVTVASYGPRTGFAPQSPAHALPRHGTAAVGAPGTPMPTGDPDGLLGKQAADGNASRHGDAYAVTLDDRAPLRLAPGATARVDAPRTRERHRDIPVFPG